MRDFLNNLKVQVGVIFVYDGSHICLGLQL
jgi:hypothetical protein